MANQQDIFRLVAAVSGQKNILSVPRLFCRLTGSLETGMLLSQMIYYSDISKLSDGWFYKTYAEWSSEVFLSKYQVGKGIELFKSLGFLETKLRKVNGSPTLHYRIDTVNLTAWIIRSHENEDSESVDDQYSELNNDRLSEMESEILDNPRKVKNFTFQRQKTDKPINKETETSTETSIQRSRDRTHARTREQSASFKDAEGQPKQPKQHVRAVRQGEETITFSTPIPLEQIPSPPVAPAPPSLPPAFEPVAPIVAEDFTAARRPERTQTQIIFGQYFPNKAMSAHQWRLIAETVTDTQQWIRVCQRWSEMYGENWRKFGLLDWYKNGLPDEQGERSNGKYTRTTKGDSGKVNAEELYPEYAAYQ